MSTQPTSPGRTAVRSAIVNVNSPSALSPAAQMPMSVLLPSALTSTGDIQPPTTITRSQSKRPPLPSFHSYHAQTHRSSPALNLMESSQVLQSMLGESAVSGPSSSLACDIDTGIRVFPSRPLTPPMIHARATRSKNKRTRNAYEEGEHTDAPMTEIVSSDKMTWITLSTPKRRRTTPFELPPGLLSVDFEQLEEQCRLPETPVAFDTARNEDRLPDTPVSYGMITPAASLVYDPPDTGDPMVIDDTTATTVLSARQEDTSFLCQNSSIATLAPRWRPMHHHESAQSQHDPHLLASL